MADIIPPIPLDAPFTSYNWVDWYNKVRRAINNAQNIMWSQINNFTGSNLTQLETRLHNTLQGLQGGTGSEYYHLTAAQNTSINSGLSVTVPLAKLTGGGANGSLTFTNGILTAKVDPT